jgi:hypothetical protein
MAINEKVSGVGANASRTDKNLSERVARVQREAKMQNASGGGYGQRAELESIAGGAPTNVPTPSMPEPSPVSQIPTVNAFEPGSGRQGIPLSDGAEFGPGRGTEAQPFPVNAPNPDSIFVRAMAAANPESRQLMMMVEAYNEMEAI